ncbi:hypothetical protein [Labilibaculum euxinus]
MTKKIKAGALQFVVLLSLLVFFLMGMFMLRAHYSNQQVNEVLVQDRLFDNLESVKVLLKNDPAMSERLGLQQINLFKSPQSIVDMNVFDWGVYKVVNVRTSWRHHVKEESLLFGDNIWDEERPSLYLTDRNRYLSVCGETWLGGPVDLPALGIRKSYVDGTGYYRDKAVQGDIRRSEATIPAIQPVYQDIFEDQFAVDFEKDSVMLWEGEKVDSLKASFKKKTLCLWSSELISLDYITIKGNVKVVSQKEIRVKNGVKLDQCILAAPIIVFEEGFKGRVQVFARDSVFIGKNSHFSFPSVIYMNGSNESKKLIIDNSVRFAGEIVVMGMNKNDTPLLKVGEGTRLEGFVYCDGTVEMEGDAAGSMYVNRFLLKTPSALYENHLLNNRLDVSDLKSSYVGVSWFGNSTKKQILECLF